MAYDYNGIATTQQGKIIYRRKKHVFKSRDMKRIAEAIGFPIDSLELFEWLIVLLDMVETSRNVINDEVREKAVDYLLSIRVYLATGEEFIGFGGGQYGGAGTTGTFLRPLVP